MPELALQQVAVQRGHAVLGRTDSPPALPRVRPGRPTSDRAMGERHRNPGIRLAEAHSTALFQFAARLPTAPLARTLGIGIGITVTWQ
ncbi:hypothetical protein [Streptomyces sp. NPDC052042]|uniref:hypothetical protein n=1 Tax=Streptomyces sp. NPDC052042 TaxID=3365683 RepID=UPI0037D04BA3